MRRIASTVGLLVALAAAPAVAQTQVSVSLGFGVPRPYVSGYVVIERPYYRHPWGYYRPRPPLVIVRRDVVVLPRRAIVVYRRPYHRHRHGRW